MSTDLKAAYRTVMDDHFPPQLEISFVDTNGRQTLVYEKVSWVIDGIAKGLRYGENPGQESALYRLLNGNLNLAGTSSILPGRHLVSDAELLQFGKHPGKTNLTDVDNALNILRYLMDTPCVAIMKHNNPSGVAKGATLLEAFTKANLADRVAAFGGAIVLNREVDLETATAMAAQYAEVVAAPGFAPGVLDVFAKKKNLRVMRLARMERLAEYATTRMVDFKSLMDGGLIAQWSFIPEARSRDQLLPAHVTHEGVSYRVARPPTDAEYDDLLFGWLVEAGVSSNSVLYVKDGVTVGIGTGEQDRVGVAEIARDKAYRKLADRLCWELRGIPYNDLRDAGARAEIDREVVIRKGGLLGSRMVSDAFFPFRDGIEVGLREGVSAVIQPGGSMRDHEVIEACNEFGAAMVFTGQRSFRH